MKHLDPVGRLAPSSLDVSRAAATRHAHLSALRAPQALPGADSPRPHRGWFHVVVARFVAVTDPVSRRLLDAGHGGRARCEDVRGGGARRA